MSLPLDRDSLPGGERLESWKQIAAYLGRSERTVRRWEESEQLPVHRLIHDKGGSVYAYTSELESWRLSRRGDVSESEPTALLTEKEVVRRKPGWKHAFVAMLCVAVILAGVGGSFWLGREKPQLSMSPPIQMTRDSGLTTDPVISRDGKLLAYASDRGDADNLDIWLQHTSGGEPVQLVRNAADDYEPEISPDDSEVIFRSDRDGGGIYSVSALGGEPRLLIKSGYLPRFSPDGGRIAYSEGNFGSGIFGGKLHIYDTATGSTKALAPNFVVSGAAAWSHDGRSLIFAASTDLVGPAYLWICSVDGAEPVLMAAKPVTDEARRFGQASTVSVAHFGDEIIVAVRQGGSSGLWTGTVSRSTHRLNGELRRITLGSGNEVLPSVSTAGRLVFASHNHSTGIWERPLTGDSPTGAMRRLTRDGALNYRPSLSQDGRKMAYISDRTGKFDVWVRDLITGDESNVTHIANPVIFAVISRDARRIAFSDGSEISVGPMGGGPSKQMCRSCGRSDDWTLTGQLVGRYNNAPEKDGIGSWDPDSGVLTKLAADPKVLANAPRVSVDGKWIVFHVVNEWVSTRTIFVIPYTGRWVPRSEWIAVTDGKALDREPSWSADGNEVYFLSDRDGFRCVWAQKLTPGTKRPEGVMFPVMHQHSPRVSLHHIPNTGYVGLNILGAKPADKKMIFAMGELTGNIWLTELR